MNELIRENKELKQRINDLEAALEIPRFTWLATPLTAAAFDGGDNFGDTAKTVIDLSAVFGVPAGVRAIYAQVEVSDSLSASALDAYLLLSWNSTAGTGIKFHAGGHINSEPDSQACFIPCDANGDIYYQVEASGNFTIKIEIIGYMR